MNYMKKEVLHTAEKKRIDMEHDNAMRALNLEMSMHDKERDKEALKQTLGIIASLQIVYLLPLYQKVGVLQ